MARNISFALTTEQIRNKTKTVTRRLGWKFLKPGDVLNACVKCMGLKPGEKIERLGQIRVVNVRREELSDMIEAEDSREAAAEGFPELTNTGFVQMFCEHMKVKPSQIVTRIEFEYDESPTTFELLRFNPRRHQRGVEAAYVRCVGPDVDCDLWMSVKDIKANISEHGEHPELKRALACYSMPHVEIR